MGSDEILRTSKQKKVSISPTWIAFWTAVVYAFGVLILGGGAGIWLPAVMPTKVVGIDALTTFVMATLAPICVDLILDLDMYGHKLTKFWRVLLVVGCIFAAVLAIVALVREKAPGEWASGIFAVILSIVIWIALAMKSRRFLPDGAITPPGGEKPAANQLPGQGLPA